MSFEEVKIILFSLVKTWLVLNISNHKKVPFPASLYLGNSLCHFIGANLNEKITSEDLAQAANFYWHGHVLKLSAFCLFTPI